MSLTYTMSSLNTANVTFDLLSLPRVTSWVQLPHQLNQKQSDTRGGAIRKRKKKQCPMVTISSYFVCYIPLDLHDPGGWYMKFASNEWVFLINISMATAHKFRKGCISSINLNFQFKICFYVLQTAI